MTAYFDAIGGRLRDLETELRALGENAYSKVDALGAIEAEVVRDVTICAEWPAPACPADIRDAIHRVVLRYAPSHQPHGASEDGGPEYEDIHDHLRGIQRMCTDLHTVFHALGMLRLDGFTDDPRRPLMELAGMGAERRERMRPPNLLYQRHVVDCHETEADRQAARERIAAWAHDHALSTTGDIAKAESARDEAMRVLSAPSDERSEPR